MAYMCIKGRGECIGCGDCEERTVCPVCGEEPESYLYKQNVDIIGCDQCIDVESVD